MMKEGVLRRIDMYSNSQNCQEFDLDEKKVESIARRISKAAQEAKEMGLIIFGGSGSGSLRYTLNQEQGASQEVAILDGFFDGGDGGDDYE